MMPVDATSILGAIGGIAELTKDVLGGDGNGGGNPSPRPGTARPPLSVPRVGTPTVRPGEPDRL